MWPRLWLPDSHSALKRSLVVRFLLMAEPCCIGNCRTEGNMAGLRWKMQTNLPNTVFTIGRLWAPAQFFLTCKLLYICCTYIVRNGFCECAGVCWSFIWQTHKNTPVFLSISKTVHQVNVQEVSECLVTWMLRSMKFDLCLIRIYCSFCCLLWSAQQKHRLPMRSNSVFVCQNKINSLQDASWTSIQVAQLPRPELVHFCANSWRCLREVQNVMFAK